MISKLTITLSKDMALELETFFGKTTAGESHIMNANIIHVGTEKKI